MTKIVSDRNLGLLVRQMALHANVSLALISPSDGHTVTLLAALCLLADGLLGASVQSQPV